MHKLFVLHKKKKNTSITRIKSPPPPQKIGTFSKILKIINIKLKRT